MFLAQEHLSHPGWEIPLDLGISLISLLYLTKKYLIIFVWYISYIYIYYIIYIISYILYIYILYHIYIYYHIYYIIYIISYILYHLSLYSPILNSHHLSRIPSSTGSRCSARPYWNPPGWPHGHQTSHQTSHQSEGLGAGLQTPAAGWLHPPPCRRIPWKNQQKTRAKSPSWEKSGRKFLKKIVTKCRNWKGFLENPKSLDKFEVGFRSTVSVVSSSNHAMPCPPHFGPNIQMCGHHSDRFLHFLTRFTVEGIMAIWSHGSKPIGSMYAIYGNIYHQNTPVMLALIYHTWIRHGKSTCPIPQSRENKQAIAAKNALTKVNFRITLRTGWRISWAIWWKVATAALRSSLKRFLAMCPTCPCPCGRHGMKKSLEIHYTK